MLRVVGLGAVRLPDRPVHLAIGMFDGVHLGHQRLVAETRAQAAGQAPAAALTFWPHPARVLAPALAPALLSSRERRLELLAEAGLGAVVGDFDEKATQAQLEALFGGWKASLFGDLHAYGPESVNFYTRGKVVSSRWPQRQAQATGLSMPTP